MTTPFRAILLLPALATAPLTADTSLRGLLGDDDLGEHWIYDDIERGRAEARATGKPLLVVFR